MPGEMATGGGYILLSGAVVISNLGFGNTGWQVAVENEGGFTFVSIQAYVQCERLVP
jgi:hypothetical protein